LCPARENRSRRTLRVLKTVTGAECSLTCDISRFPAHAVRRGMRGRARISHRGHADERPATGGGLHSAEGAAPCLLMGTPAAALWGRTRGARACAKPPWLVRCPTGLRRPWNACAAVAGAEAGVGGRLSRAAACWSTRTAEEVARRRRTEHGGPLAFGPLPSSPFCGPPVRALAALHQPWRSMGRPVGGIGQGARGVLASGHKTHPQWHMTLMKASSTDKRARRFPMITFAMPPQSRPALRAGPPRGFPPAAGPTWASSALLEAAARYAERAGAHLGGHADQAECAGCRRAKGRRQLHERDRRGQEAICHSPVVRSWRESFLRCVSFADRSVREIPAPVRALATQERNNDSNPRDDGCGWGPLRESHPRSPLANLPPCCARILVPNPSNSSPSSPPPTPARPSCVSALASPVGCNRANAPLLNGAVRAAALRLGHGGVHACWFAAPADATWLAGAAGDGRGGVSTNRIIAGIATTRGDNAGTRDRGTGGEVAGPALSVGNDRAMCRGRLPWAVVAPVVGHTEAVGRRRDEGRPTKAGGGREAVAAGGALVAGRLIRAGACVS